ncbi:hypothetical protein COL922a_010288 [Colletotrichum nupharicola]|nr:hypothetical protein COL922a_010288 [Colletotrichum nupharicola]
MSASHSDSDAVMIGPDDISDYNPGQILPEPPEVIENPRAWLQPTKYDLESGEYRKHLSSYAPSTGEWITSNSTYDHWLKGEEQGLLWIKGIPGSGKSVLTSKIVRDLSQNQPATPVLYFFFRKIIDANHEPVALLRDWLDQLLVYSPPLQKQIKRYVESKRSLNSMSMEGLWNDLRVALSGLHGKVFCIVDALDEMGRHHWTFIRALGELGTWKPHRVKVLVTSRFMPEMEPLMRYPNHSQIQLQSDLVDVDIATYVRTSLESSDTSLEDQKFIREAIPGQAHGIFLYAKFAIDAFLNPGANAKKVLKAFLQDMSAIYSNLLREHSRRSGVPQDVQLFILQWITHANRPLGLLEMADIIKTTHHSLVNQDLKLSKDIKDSLTQISPTTRATLPFTIEGNTDNVSQLIENGHADFNAAVPSNGKTPLFFLLDLDRNATFLALKLLEYGPDCKVVDSEGNGVLHVALGKSNPDARITKKLIESGADVNLRNKSDMIPMDVMSLSGEYAKEIWDMLLSAGAEINDKDKHGCTAIFRMEYPRLDFLISRGLDLLVVDNDGNSLLHELSWHPSNFDNFTSVIPVWKQLLDLGLDPQQSNKKGRTPLHNLSCKARRGSSEPDATYPLDLLISWAGIVDAADEDGITPLHIAVTASEYHTKKLLDAGANPNVATNEDLTPLHLAVRSRQSNIVGLLLDSLYQLAGLEDARRGVWLADDRPLPIPGVNHEDKKGQTPLHYASSQKRQLGPSRHQIGHEETPFDKCLVKYRDETTITALRNYGGIKKGRPNRKLLWSILKRRQYCLVEELFHCGVDFFAENRRLRLTGLE